LALNPRILELVNDQFHERIVIYARYSTAHK